MGKENYTVILSKIDELTHDVRNFHLEFKDKPRFDFIPGQFVMVEVPKDDKTVRKPYSIASAPHIQDKIELCIKKVEGGFVSSWFFGLKEGDKLNIQGPLGTFSLKEPLPNHLIFVATGTGIAPLRSQIQHLLFKGDTRKITLIFGNRYENEILFDSELQGLETQYANFEYIPVISRPDQWKGKKGYVQEILREKFSEPNDRAVYICGLVPMVNGLRETLAELEYPKEAVHYEKWT